MSNCSSARAIVLLIDDDPNDHFLFQRAFSRAGVTHNLILLDDSERALAYLRGAPPYNDRATHPLPHLIFLDLKMPKISGLELLACMKQKLGLKIPVVILSSSALPEDQQAASAQGAVAYHVKPADPDDLRNLIRLECNRFLGSEPSRGATRLHRAPRDCSGA